jgi:hypothetical protein
LAAGVAGASAANAWLAASVKALMVIKADNVFMRDLLV